MPESPLVTKYIPYAKAIRGKFLPGGVQRWRGAKQDTKQQAEDLLAAYLDKVDKSIISGTKICEVEVRDSKKPVGLSAPQAKLLADLATAAADGRTFNVVESYKPAQVLVKLGFAEWKEGRLSTTLAITKEGSSFYTGRYGDE